MVEPLHERRCQACEGGVAPMTEEEIRQSLQEIPGWEYDPKQQCIKRRFDFTGYLKTMAFVNAVAWMAYQNNHHPVMTVHYNACDIHYQTHAISGLSINDFICAAQVNRLWM